MPRPSCHRADSPNIPPQVPDLAQPAPRDHLPSCSRRLWRHLPGGTAIGPVVISRARMAGSNPGSMP